MEIQPAMLTSQEKCLWNAVWHQKGNENASDALECGRPFGSVKIDPIESALVRCECKGAFVRRPHLHRNIWLSAQEPLECLSGGSALTEKPHAWKMAMALHWSD